MKKEIKRTIFEKVMVTIESPSKKKVLWLEEIKYADGSTAYEVRKQITDKITPTNEYISDNIIKSPNSNAH